MMRDWIVIALLGAALAAGCQDSARQHDTTRTGDRNKSGMPPPKDAAGGGGNNPAAEKSSGNTAPGNR
jgi:hypothetical protein